MILGMKTNSINQKNIYYNVHHINIEVLEKKKTYKNISPTFKYLNFIFFNCHKF